MNLSNMSFFGNGYEYADEPGATSNMQLLCRLVRLNLKPNYSSTFLFHCNLYGIIIGLESRYMRFFRFENSTHVVFHKIPL